MMNCDKVSELVDLYVAGELDSEISEGISSHARTCNSCKRSLEDSKDVISSLDIHFSSKPSIKYILQGNLDGRAVGHLEAGRPLAGLIFRWAGALGFAAIILVVIVVALFKSEETVYYSADLSDRVRLWSNASADWNKSSERSINLNKGDVIAQVRDGDNEELAISVVTGQGIITDIGTEFYVVADSESTAVAVFEGTVKFSAPGESVTVKKGGLYFRNGLVSDVLPGEVKLTGTCVSPQGNPVGNVFVIALFREKDKKAISMARTDEEGIFRIGYESESNVEFIFYSHGYVPKKVTGAGNILVNNVVLELDED